MSLSYRAMQFARHIHKEQVRKYTGNPYTDHLAEVAGIVATVDSSDETIATAWLHDCREDHGVTGMEIEIMFGMRVAVGVALLSDLESRKRKRRTVETRMDKRLLYLRTVRQIHHFACSMSKNPQHEIHFLMCFYAACSISGVIVTREY